MYPLPGLGTEGRQAIAMEHQFLTTLFMDPCKGDILKPAYGLISRTSRISVIYALDYQISFVSVVEGVTQYTKSTYSLVLYMLYVLFSDCHCPAVLLLLLLDPLTSTLFPYSASKAQFCVGIEKLNLEESLTEMFQASEDKPLELQ